MVAEPRRDLPVPVRVEMRRPDGATSIEYAVNISPGGLCLHLSGGLSEGDEVHVEFTLPPSGPTVRADASVVWTSDAREGEGTLSEIGLKFESPEASVREQLAQYASQPINRRR